MTSHDNHMNTNTTINKTPPEKYHGAGLYCIVKMLLFAEDRANYVSYFLPNIISLDTEHVARGGKLRVSKM